MIVGIINAELSSRKAKMFLKHPKYQALMSFAVCNLPAWSSSPFSNSILTSFQI